MSEPRCRCRRIFIAGMASVAVVNSVASSTANAALVITRGALGALPLAVSGGDGTKGIFQLGYGACGPSTTRNKYTYATCVSTACGVGAASASVVGGSGAGNYTRGILSLGSYCSAQATYRDKYIYSTCSSAATTPFSAPSLYGAAAGNSTRGIFARGLDNFYWYYCCCCEVCVPNYQAGPAREKYTYATDSAASATSSAVTNYGGASAGNGTRGIFALSCTGVESTARDKYTYADDTSVTAAASSQIGHYGSAAGNSTRGIFHLGRPCGTVRDKYTYATDTNGSATAPSEYSFEGSATGNSTRGIFALGYNAGSTRISTRNKYTYACDTNTASGVGAASVASGDGAATSWATGVNS